MSFQIRKIKVIRITIFMKSSFKGKARLNSSVILFYEFTKFFFAPLRKPDTHAKIKLILILSLLYY